MCIRDSLKPARLVGEKRARDRILTDNELFAFWRATGHMDYPSAPLYRLLILTGLRLNEVADAKWSEFDLRSGVWIIPAARMKGKDGRAVDHVVPITDGIAAILESLPRFKSGEYLFSVTFGKTPVWVSDKIKKRLDARILRTPVSYTHLDVYKRQLPMLPPRCCLTRAAAS